MKRSLLTAVVIFSAVLIGSAIAKAELGNPTNPISMHTPLVSTQVKAVIETHSRAFIDELERTRAAASSTTATSTSE